MTSHAPLRGSKGMIYEGGIRVPLAVRWSGRIRPGRESSQLVTTVDFYPTILGLAGLVPSPGQRLDGMDLTDQLLGSEDVRATDRSIFWHEPVYLEAYEGLGVGPWRITPCGAVRRGKWKLIEFYETGAMELYNLDQDPGETLDLAEEEPERAAAEQSLTGPGPTF